MSRLPPVTSATAAPPEFTHAAHKGNVTLRPDHIATLREHNPTVPVRHMDFGFETAPLTRYFYDNNAVATAFFLAFSAVIPQGERFFIHSVRQYRDQLNDPELEARVTGFIGQEAMHGKEHDAANAAYEKMGYPIGRIDRSVREALKLLAKTLPKPAQLAFTVALEHYTAIIAEDVMRREAVQQKFAPEIGALILWHMMEETEHKAVAFDVYDKCVGSYALRAGVMVPTTLALIAALANLQFYLLHHDGALRRPGQWRAHLRGFAEVYGPRGLFGRVLPQLLDYFKPGFHPNHHDTEELLARFREKFFGAQGELNAHLRKTVLPPVRSVA